MITPVSPQKPPNLVANIFKGAVLAHLKPAPIRSSHRAGDFVKEAWLLCMESHEW